MAASRVEIIVRVLFVIALAACGKRTSPNAGWRATAARAPEPLAQAALDPKLFAPLPADVRATIEAGLDLAAAEPATAIGIEAAADRALKVLHETRRLAGDSGAPAKYPYSPSDQAVHDASLGVLGALVAAACGFRRPNDAIRELVTRMILVPGPGPYTQPFVRNDRQDLLDACSSF